MNFIGEYMRSLDLEQSLRRYWANNSEMSLIKQSYKRLSKVRKVSLEKLFINQSIEQPIQVSFNPIMSNEDSFLNLLFYGGYLTSASAITMISTTRGRYKIPNKEVSMFFYDDVLPKWINWCYNPQIQSVELVTDLCAYIENKDAYKATIQKYLLNYLDSGSKTEADFQAILVGSAIHGRCLDVSSHSAHSEVCTQDKTKIDTLFLPIKNKSETIIIHEYKKVENSNLKEQALDLALWQIYINNYIAEALQEIKESLHFAKFIIVRAIVFFKGSNGGWNIEIVQLMHTIENATRLCDIFKNKILDDEISKRTLIEQKEQRFRLLSSISNDATTIYEFLLDFSSSKREEERKEEEPSENEPRKKSRAEVKIRQSERLKILKNLKNLKPEKRKLSPGPYKKTLRK